MLSWRFQALRSHLPFLPFNMNNNKGNIDCNIYISNTTRIPPPWKTIISPIGNHCIRGFSPFHLTTRLTIGRTIKQESPAIADKPARRESMPKLLQFNVLTTLSLTILAYLCVLLLLCPKSAKSREIHRKFKVMKFKVIQGHRSWCQSKAHMWLAISH